jgi:hypothetical protein
MCRPQRGKSGSGSIAAQAPPLDRRRIYSCANHFRRASPDLGAAGTENEKDSWNLVDELEGVVETGQRNDPLYIRHVLGQGMQVSESCGKVRYLAFGAPSRRQHRAGIGRAMATRSGGRGVRRRASYARLTPRLARRHRLPHRCLPGPPGPVAPRGRSARSSRLPEARRDAGSRGRPGDRR